MPLRLGDHNESVRTWRAIMNARFGGLYTRLHGPLPTNTGVFGPQAVLWQKEYESRTQQPQDGVVSDNDLHELGITVPVVVEPVCVVFSINGAASTWSMGYPYDIGETLDKSKMWHQPIGYDTRPFPMRTGVQDGIRELIRQLDMPRGSRGLNCTVLPWAFIAYSMGALAAMAVLDRVLHGDLGRFKSTYIGSATFGNPRRQNGHTFPGCINSDGEGIALPNDHDMPDTHWDFAASKAMPGSSGDDLYTKIGIPGENPTTQKDMRAVWDIVNTGNPTSLAIAVLMLLAHPGFSGGYSAAVAALHALNFFVVKGVSPHVRYQFCLPLANNSRDCWELAREHMADLVARVPRP
jgi:hypothetical protein